VRFTPKEAAGMASLVITSVSITPTSSSATNAVITIDYTYELTLSTIDVQNEANAAIASLLKALGGAAADITSSGVDFRNGMITMSNGTNQAIPGKAEVDVWGDDAGDRVPNWYADDDDKRLTAQDPHPVVCKSGTQTVARSFTVASRNLDEDTASQDEIYLHLKVKLPTVTLEAESAVIAGAWAG
jgi:hypothetical protein